MGMFTVSRIRRKRAYRSDWLKTAKSDRQFLGFVCEKCGSSDRVERHHILEKSKHKGRDCLLNLMLLCRNCHKRKHKR